MKMTDFFLAQLEAEAVRTRRALERVPDNLDDWKPHDKSFPMGALAQHLSNIPGWTTVTIQQDQFDVAPEGTPTKAEPLGSMAEILNVFDENVAKARAAIAGASDEQMFQTWTLLSGGKPIFSLPRIGCLRGFVMNHMIHHRAQLGVYLRLNDIPVPSIYGPSADEGQF